MSLTSRIKDNLKKAIKEGTSLEVSVLRMLSAALHNEEIACGGELSEDEEIKVISKEAKKRCESIEAYRQGGRDDLARKEERELEIIKTYLPEQSSEEDLRELVEEGIEKVGAQDLSDMGKVMGFVMPKVKGRADGERVKNIVEGVLG